MDTIACEFVHGGLLRRARSSSDIKPDNTSDEATVTFAYSSLNYLLEKAQNIYAVSGRWIMDASKPGGHFHAQDHLRAGLSLRPPLGKRLSPRLGQSTLNAEQQKQISDFFARHD